MVIDIENSWKEQLESEFEKDYFKQLASFVDDEYNNHICYPKQSEIFAAFNACTFDDVKVVIIGQDPYHGEDQANGLCFSVRDHISVPPSLINIFKELKEDLGIEIPCNGNLQKWATQGVLLLNATLTVRANEAGSHQKQGWEKFTNAVIDVLSKNKENVVFMLWGGYAKKKGAKIDSTKHCVLTSGHPSPLSANRGYWFGNKHFSLCNNYLSNKDLPTIKW